MEGGEWKGWRWRVVRVEGGEDGGWRVEGGGWRR